MSDSPNQEEKHPATVNKENNEKTNPPVAFTSSETQPLRKTISKQDIGQDRTYRLKRWGLIVQIALFLATTGAFIAAARYAHIAHEQSKSIQISADAAKKSAEIAEKTMVATQRPWISVQLRIGSGLKFSNEGGRITMAFILKNVGNSPAVGINVNAGIFLSSPKRNSRDEQTKICGQGSNLPTTVGHMLFPGEQMTYSISMPISQEDITQSRSEFYEAYKKFPSPVFINPILTGCVKYAFTFDGSIHKTGFMAELTRFEPSSPAAAFLIVPTAGNVPIELLKLSPSPFGNYGD